MNLSDRMKEARKDQALRLEDMGFKLLCAHLWYWDEYIPKETELPRDFKEIETTNKPRRLKNG